MVDDTLNSLFAKFMCLSDLAARDGPSVLSIIDFANPVIRLLVRAPGLLESGCVVPAG
jgi:hypothetical protein